ncbi:MAG: hypothetical protein WCK58_14750, partial [Chloroflexota bacterium]
MPARPRSAHGGGVRISDARLWQAGFIVGAVAGAAITVAGRRLEHSARRAGLVDWQRVEEIAIGRLRRAPGGVGRWRS